MSKTKNGSDWRYEIYFNPNSDTNVGRAHRITDEELIEKLSKLVDVDEVITNVTIYKLPLSEWQLTDFLFYHNFVVFETEDWYWSIEKNGEGITIQRSKMESAVKDKYRQKDRISGIRAVISDSGRKSVEELITWLYRENELNKKYNYVSSNCKHFAQRVFNYVAAQKTY